jgi:hypothetical protein
MHRIRRRPAGPHAQDSAQRRSRPPAGAMPRERDRKALRSRQAGPPPPARLRSQPHLCAHSRARFRAPRPRATPTCQTRVPRPRATPARHAGAPHLRVAPARHICAQNTRGTYACHIPHTQTHAAHLCATPARQTRVPTPARPKTDAAHPRAHTRALTPTRPHPRAHTHAALTRATSRTPKPTRHTRAPHLCAPHPARPHPARLYLRIHASQARLTTDASAPRARVSGLGGDL